MASPFLVGQYLPPVSEAWALTLSRPHSGSSYLRSYRWQKSLCPHLAKYPPLDSQYQDSLGCLARMYVWHRSTRLDPFRSRSILRLSCQSNWSCWVCTSRNLLARSHVVQYASWLLERKHKAEDPLYHACFGHRSWYIYGHWWHIVGLLVLHDCKHSANKLQCQHQEYYGPIRCRTGWISFSVRRQQRDCGVIDSFLGSQFHS